MRQNIETRIKRQEAKKKEREEPTPEDYGRGTTAYGETGTFPEGTHPKVKEYALKAWACAEAIRESMGVKWEPEIIRIPFPEEPLTSQES